MAQFKQADKQAQVKVASKSELSENTAPALAQIQTLVSSLTKEIGELKQALMVQNSKVDHLEQQLVKATVKATAKQPLMAANIDAAIEAHSMRPKLVPAVVVSTQTEQTISTTQNSTNTTTRRNLLKRMSMVAAGLAAVTTAATSLNPGSVQAASGDFILLGNSNMESDATYLSQVGSASPSDKAIFWADWNTTTKSTAPTVKAGVAGTGGDSDAVGGYFAGSRAPLLLQPATATGAPSGSTAHSKGELYVDSAGNLFICQADGSPGSWVQVNGGSGGGSGGVQLAQDLGGTTSLPKVIGLQGKPVSATAPTSGQVLTYSGSQWAAATPSGGGGGGGGSQTFAGYIDAAGALRSTSQTPQPSSGSGLELYYDTTDGSGNVAAYNRTNSAYKPLNFGGSSINFYQGSVSIDNNLSVDGVLSKGSGSFTIPHPNPTKTADYDLRHCFVESPTRGENLYRFSVTAKKSGDVVTVSLPDYWQYLNENPQVWVSGDGQLGRAYGKVNAALTILSINCELAGDYNVLLIGTRKDEVAKAWWDDRGVEKKVSEDWTTANSNLKTSSDRTSEIVRAIKNKNKEPKKPGKP